MKRQEQIDAPPSALEFKTPNTISLEFAMLTPLFGGGAESRQPLDEDMPLRGSAIRGQLRFWWRAARGGQYKTLDELRAAEVRLWGEGTAPGIASLSTKSDKPSFSKEHYFEKDHRGNWRPSRGKESLAYMGFSLQPTKDEARAGIAARPAIAVSGKHTLTITLHASASDDDRQEIEAAVWAWSHFGGIGGRTRRGFGAVSTSDTESLRDLLSSKHIVDKRPPEEGIPSLAPSAGAQLVALSGSGPAAAQWKAIADKYQAFHQGKNVGRNTPQPGKWAGRSRWPEPDVIRHNTDRHNSGDPQHQQRIVNVDKAPRGQFGMPVIFHFIERIEDLTLKPQGYERYGSPLILRPLGQKDKAYGVALVLGNRPNLDHLDGGVVLTQGRSKYPVQVKLTAADAAAMREPLGADPDPLLSFLKFLK